MCRFIIMEPANIRIVIVGDSGSGKSCIVHRLVNNEFSQNTPKTTGASYLCHTFESPYKAFKLCIWDTSGQEKYFHLTQLYSRNCNAVIIACDGASPNPPASLDKWFNKMHNDTRNDTIFFVVICKMDLVKNSQSFKEIEFFCKKINVVLVKTSAKLNENIEELFNKLTERFCNFKSEVHKKSIFLSHASHSVLLEKKKKKCC